MSHRDPDWTEADAGTFGDGRLAPADEATLERQQATRYTPTPLPRGLYGEHRYKPHRAILRRDPPGSLPACDFCGHRISWHAPSWRRIPGREWLANWRVPIPAHWVHV